MTTRRARATEFGGTRYRSGYEAEIARALRAAKVSFGYESQLLFYETAHTYTPDFHVETASGGSILIEAKGYFTAADRTKLLAVREANPDADIRLLFQNAKARLTRARGSKSYGEWATSKGFKWAQGTSVPAAWINE